MLRYSALCYNYNMTRSKTHKITSPMPKRSTRKMPRKRRGISLKKSYIIVFAVAPVLATICLALAFHLNRPHATPADDPADTKYYFANSKYRDITSKFVQRRNRTEQTSIEYPITKNQKINDTIAATIDEKYRGFRDALAKQSAHITEPFTNTASYQVLRNDDRFISITVLIKQNMHTTHSEQYLLSWTFDKQTGDIAGSNDLASTNPPDNPTPSPAAPQNSTIRCSGKCIALTFDDGPGAHTMRLLDTLDAYHAKATFFVIGEKVAAHHAILQQQAARGHQIGNHSWRHPDLTALAPSNVANEITQTNRAIHAATKQTPAIMRPPYGAINASVSQQLQTFGMSSVLWSVDTRDWADRDSNIVCSRAVSNARAGAIILFHDIHPTSVDAIPCVLNALSKQGFTFVTIDTLFGGKLQPGRSYFSAM